MDSSEDARLSGGAGGDSIRHRCSKSRRHVAPVRVSASCAAGGHALRYRWEVALEYGLQQLVHAALERAIHGVARPHYFQGEKVGEHRVYSESLTRSEEHTSELQSLMRISYVVLCLKQNTIISEQIVFTNV